ncbi:MAG TPA: AAA-like domain-containing protein, partial [Thermoanaerobaculia bacterium]|nr:AAA-like domain-containing protein [Thermoanaerobaculia bacterium]
AVVKHWQHFAQEWGVAPDAFVTAPPLITTSPEAVVPKVSHVVRTNPWEALRMARKDRWTQQRKNLHGKEVATALLFDVAPTAGPVLLDRNQPLIETRRLKDLAEECCQRAAAAVLAEERVRWALDGLWLCRVARRDRPEVANEELRGRLFTEGLRGLCEMPPEDAVWAEAEAGEAMKALLGRWEWNLAGAVRDLDSLATRLLAMMGSEQTERQRFDDLLASATALCDRLADTPLKYIPAGVRASLEALASTWREFITRRTPDREARLELSIHAGEGDPSRGRFSVEILLTNTGTETARDVTLNRLPVWQVSRRGNAAEASAVDLIAAKELPDIAAGAARRVALSVTGVRRESEACTLEGDVRYRGALLRDISRFEQVIRVPWSPQQQPLPDDANPFQVGPPVSPGAPSFVDRPQILRDIRQALKHNVVLLHGLRRVGKTSLLYSLLADAEASTARDALTPAYLNIQQYGGPEYDTGRFLRALAEEIVRALAKRGVTGLEVGEVERWRSERTVAMNEFLQRAKALAGDRRVLLLLDEFEVFLQKVINNHFDREIIGYLRSIMQEKERSFLSFVIVGATRVREMVKRDETPLFNLVYPIRVSFLQRAEAEQLLRVPIARDFVIEERAVTELLRETAGHPYFLQLVCYELFSQMRDEATHRRVITLLDARRAFKTAIDRGGGNQEFAYLLEKSDLEPIQQAIIGAVAKNTENGPCDAATVVSQLNELGCEITESELFEKVLSLADMDLADYPTPRPDHTLALQLRFPLFARWFRRNRDLRHVVERAVRVAFEDDLPEGRMEEAAAPEQVLEGLPEQEEGVPEPQEFGVPPQDEPVAAAPATSEPPMDPYRSSDLFYGREKWLRHARDLFCTPRNSGHLEICGGAQIGKTTLLNQIQAM